MTDEAKRCVEHLRENAEFQWCSDCYISDGCGDAYKSNCFFLRLADLIESLAAELEWVKRERDAAVEGLRGDCGICAHRQGCVDNDFVIGRSYYNSCWEWRGVKEGAL